MALGDCMRRRRGIQPASRSSRAAPSICAVLLLELFVSHSAAANVLEPRHSMEKTMAAHFDSGQRVPMLRDRYGRIRVPAMINGKGPYSLILDTGANNSAVSSNVAASLGAALDELPPTIMHGVTGSTVVPTIQVDSISIGAFRTPPTKLPIVLDALDGADGFLSMNSLAERRIVIDLKNDLMTLSNRPSNRSDRRDVTLRVAPSASRMLIIDTRIKGVRVKTIVDTGAQATIGNLAMQAAVGGVWPETSPKDRIFGTTAAMQAGTTRPLPPLSLGSLWILGGRISYADVPIFRKLDLASEPAMLIGMDILGKFESLILDFRNQTLQLRPGLVARS
jgi:predicted aspartyl protease